MCSEKKKALISCKVTAQLICGFVFAYAKIQFSHDMPHILAEASYILFTILDKEISHLMTTPNDTNKTVNSDGDSDQAS